MGESVLERMGQALVHKLHFDWCLKSRCKTKIASYSYRQGRRKKSEAKEELSICSYSTADPELSPLQCVRHAQHQAARFTFQCCMNHQSLSGVAVVCTWTEFTAPHVRAAAGWASGVALISPEGCPQGR